MAWPVNLDQHVHHPASSGNPTPSRNPASSGNPTPSGNPASSGNPTPSGNPATNIQIYYKILDFKDLQGSLKAYVKSKIFHHKKKAKMSGNILNIRFIKKCVILQLLDLIYLLSQFKRLVNSVLFFFLFVERP